MAAGDTTVGSRPILRCAVSLYHSKRVAKATETPMLRLKYSIFGGVVPRRAEFRQIAREINGLKKVGV